MNYDLRIIRQFHFYLFYYSIHFNCRIRLVNNSFMADLKSVCRQKVLEYTNVNLLFSNLKAIGH